jgi:AraC-like DNA-binding protein
VLITPASLPPIDLSLRWAKHHVWGRGETMLNQEMYAYSLMLCLDGDVELTFPQRPLSERRFVVHPGEAFVSPCYGRREVRAIGPNGGEWLTIGVTAFLPGPVDLFAAFNAPCRWIPANAELDSLKSLLTQIIIEFGDREWPDSSIASLISLSLAQAVVGIFWRGRFGGDGQPAAFAFPDALPSWLADTLHRMTVEPGGHLPEHIRQSGVSESQFRRTFHRYLATTPQTYLTERRLEAARRLLETTDRTVEEIAESIGFESLAHFTRRFKAAVGVPPGRYRQISRLPESKRANA